jgi:aminoglycoside phosphotransferase (APT) family kinase protein
MNATQGDKVAWKVVSPPPPLSAGAVDALLEPWRAGRSVVEVQPLTGGIMNWNYRIGLAGSAERFVLRFYDRMPASCAKEVRILGLLADTIPVPRVITANTSGVHGLPPFCVLEFIDGISLRELRRRGAATSVQDACYDAGRLLPTLRALTFEHSGLLSAVPEVTPGPFADASLGEVIAHFARTPALRSRVDAPLRQSLQRFADGSSGLMADAESACLVHGDFNSPNLFVHERQGQWRVAAILDWEFAFAGSPWCDVGNMLRYERLGRPRYEPGFSRGLRDGGLALGDEWFAQARIADLPALCQLLARDDVPPAIVVELVDLMRGTIEG